MTDADTPTPKKPELPEREYIVASARCVWGKVGEVIKLALTDMQELTHIQAGTLKRFSANAARGVEQKEGKDNG